MHSIGELVPIRRRYHGGVVALGDCCCITRAERFRFAGILVFGGFIAKPIMVFRQLTRNSKLRADRNRRALKFAGSKVAALRRRENLPITTFWNRPPALV